MYSDQIIHQVQASANLVNIVAGYVPMQGSHKVLKGSCPFHADNLNSFMVSPQKNIFKCFGCGKDGGPIEFLMAIEGKTRQEAISILVQNIGLNLEL